MGECHGLQGLQLCDKERTLLPFITVFWQSVGALVLDTSVLVFTKNMTVPAPKNFPSI